MTLRNLLSTRIRVQASLLFSGSIMGALLVWHVIREIMGHILFFVFVLNFLLSACTSKNLAPVEFRITPILERALKEEKERSKLSGSYWIVKRGDTLSSIAKRFGLAVDEIVRANNLEKPDQISVGQRLALPKHLKKFSIVESVSNTSVRNIQKKKVHKENVEFIWPARGSVVVGYGRKQNGLVSDGINIALPLGSPILATANGEVIYVGRGVRGFGNLLMLRHRDGWISAYAHTQEIFVKRGDYVQQGERIASAGSTGMVQKSQLHFELRQGTKPVNPLKKLVPGAT